MCLVLEDDQLERLVAKEDIPIFKVIRHHYDDFVTLFQCSEVKFDKLTESFLEEPKDGVGYVGITDGVLYGHVLRIGISRGIHVLDNKIRRTALGRRFLKELLDYDSNSYLIKGYIPKGSEYYHNHRIHSIATNQVIYLKKFINV